MDQYCILTCRYCGRTRRLNEEEAASWFNEKEAQTA